MVLIYIGVLAIFFFVYAVIGFLSNKLGFSREDKITAQFCGTKKSLVHGTVFSKILFPASMPTGIILLPLILFHASQILIISFQATRLGKELEEDQIKSE